MLLRLLILLFVIPVHATVFQLQSVDQQIKESSGIVVGHYLRKKSIKLEDGSIATQMIFKMNKEVGMQSELFGMDEIIIHYPGGKIGDLTVKVEGVPSFVPGESVVLMVKNHQDRYWGMNLGFGTFKIVNYGNEKMIVNTLFPHDRRVGQIKFDDFEKQVKRIKGSSLKVVMAPVYPTETDETTVTRLPASIEEGKNRAIASNSETEENNESNSGFNSIWLLFVLASMGGLFRFLRQKEAR